MILGFSRFNPWPIVSPFKPMSMEEQTKVATQKINETLETINSWCTLMNIFEFKGWNDPLTGDLHIVVRADKLMKATHVGEAVEKKDGP